MSIGRCRQGHTGMLVKLFRQGQFPFFISYPQKEGIAIFRNRPILFLFVLR